MTLPEHTTNLPATVPSLAADLLALGVQPGMTLLVHSSLRSLGWDHGSAAAVILALEQALTLDGTLVMPTHTADNSDPANWIDPPVPESWWETIRQTMPAYDPSLTPTFRMGAIPETFRKQNGVIRSSNPEASFAAWGKHKATITDHHAPFSAFGSDSPLARVYDLDGWVLLLGVGHGNNTSLHYAEFKARISHEIMRRGTSLLVDGVRQWASFDDIDWNSDDFVALGADFARTTGLQREAKIARADAILVPQRPLIDFAVPWLEQHRS